VEEHLSNKDLLGMPLGAARHWRAEGEGGMARRYRNKQSSDRLCRKVEFLMNDAKNG
jgi:hypothetical protein